MSLLPFVLLQFFFKKSVKIELFSVSKWWPVFWLCVQLSFQIAACIECCGWQWRSQRRRNPSGLLEENRTNQGAATTTKKTVSWLIGTYTSRRLLKSRIPLQENHVYDEHHGIFKNSENFNFLIFYGVALFFLSFFHHILVRPFWMPWFESVSNLYQSTFLSWTSVKVLLGTLMRTGNF